MINIIKEIILDFQEMDLESGVPRHIDIQTINKKASVFIGVRRSGKSVYLYQLIEGLVKKNISRENILYINFFDDRLHKLKDGDLSVISEAYYSLYPDKKGIEVIYCFFDEIQVLKGWEAFIDRMMRNEKCEVYISGSSAQMLSQEIATQMRGRALSWEIFPFTFAEYLDYAGTEIRSNLSATQRLKVIAKFEEYWQKGGFPEVAGLDSRLRIKIHQEYLTTILFRDIIERHNISHPKALTDLVHWLLDNIASLYSINRLTNYLSSLGHKTSKTLVANYLNWFEDAYFLYTVRLYDASLIKSNANAKKIYCVDHAFVSSISTGILVNSGHLLENLVFMALRRTGEKVFYYRTQNKREVDFIVIRKGRKPVLIQVSETLVEERTYMREVRALEEAMKEMTIEKGFIITRNEEEIVNTKSANLYIIPVWKFLLQWPENELFE